MNYQAIFSGWNNITLEDMLVAYRKAKADNFFENTFPSAVKFAEYETDLINNLKNLIKFLKKDKGFEKTKHLSVITDCSRKKFPLKRKTTKTGMPTSPTPSAPLKICSNEILLFRNSGSSETFQLIAT